VLVETLNASDIVGSAMFTMVPSRAVMKAASEIERTRRVNLFRAMGVPVVPILLVLYFCA
jgi:hypothetical protein